MSAFWTTASHLAPVLIVGFVIGVAAWIGSGHLRDRAEATRQQHDRESFIDWLEEPLYGPAAVWPLDEKAETFDQTLARIHRIRAQIRANEQARFEREVLADIEQLPEVAS